MKLEPTGLYDKAIEYDKRIKKCELQLDNLGKDLSKTLDIIDDIQTCQNSIIDNMGAMQEIGQNNFDTINAVKKSHSRLISANSICIIILASALIAVSISAASKINRLEDKIMRYQSQQYIETQIDSE